MEETIDDEAIPIWRHADPHPVPEIAFEDNSQREFDIAGALDNRPPTPREYTTPIGKPIPNGAPRPKLMRSVPNETAGSQLLYPRCPQLVTYRNKPLPLLSLSVIVEVYFDVAIITTRGVWYNEIAGGSDLLYLLPYDPAAVVSAVHMQVDKRVLSSRVVPLSAAAHYVHLQKSVNLVGAADADKCINWVPGVFRAPIRSVRASSQISVETVVTAPLHRLSSSDAASIGVGPCSYLRFPIYLDQNTLRGKDPRDVLHFAVLVHCAGPLPWIGCTLPIASTSEAIVAADTSELEYTSTQVDAHFDDDDEEDTLAALVHARNNAQVRRRTVSAGPRALQNFLQSHRQAFRPPAEVLGRHCYPLQSCMSMAHFEADRSLEWAASELVLTIPVALAASVAPFVMQPVLRREVSPGVIDSQPLREEQCRGLTAHALQARHEAGTVHDLRCTVVLSGSTDGDSPQFTPFPRSLVYVIDAPAIMSGIPLATVVSEVLHSIAALAPTDRFSIVLCNVPHRGLISFKEILVAPTAQNIKAANQFLAKLVETLNGSAGPSIEAIRASSEAGNRMFQSPVSRRRAKQAAQHRNQALRAASGTAAMARNAGVPSAIKEALKLLPGETEGIAGGVPGRKSSSAGEVKVRDSVSEIILITGSAFAAERSTVGYFQDLHNTDSEQMTERHTRTRAFRNPLLAEHELPAFLSHVFPRLSYDSKAYNFGRVRVHSFGIGPFVNPLFISHMASACRGTSRCCLSPGDLLPDLRDFLSNLAKPMLIGIGMDFDGTDIADLDAAVLMRDLHSGETLTWHCSYVGELPRIISLHGLARSIDGTPKYVTLEVLPVEQPCAMPDSALRERLNVMIASAWLNRNNSTLEKVVAGSIVASIPTDVTALVLAEDKPLAKAELPASSEEIAVIEDAGSRPKSSSRFLKQKSKVVRGKLDDIQKEILRRRARASVLFGRSLEERVASSGLVRVLGATPGTAPGNPAAIDGNVPIDEAMTRASWAGRKQAWWNRLDSDAYRRRYLLFTIQEVGAIAYKLAVRSEKVVTGRKTTEELDPTLQRLQLATLDTAIPPKEGLYYHKQEVADSAIMWDPQWTAGSGALVRSKTPPWES